MLKALLAGTAALALAWPASAQRVGKGGTGVDETAELPRCERPLGTVALVEEKRSTNASGALPPQFAALLELAERQQGLARVDPLPLLKLLAAQSGCFQVVDRGEGFDALQRERALAAGQQLVNGQALGGQTLEAADYMLTANVIYQDERAGGGGGGLGGIGGGGGGLIGIKSKRLEAQTMLTLVAVKTGIQEAVATGAARKRDIRVLGGGLVGLGIGALAGGYESTDIGKITSLALLDSFRKLIASALAARAVGVEPAATTTTISATPAAATTPSVNQALPGPGGR